MCVQSVYQRWSFHDETHSCVAMTVNATLMTLGQAKPALQLEVVLELLQRGRADKQAGGKACHDLSHLEVNRVLRGGETLLQVHERTLPLGAGLRLRVEGHRYRRDVFDVATQGLLLVVDSVEAAVDAVREAAQLLLCEPPFFSSKLRCSDSRTSTKAAAMRRPGG